MRRRLDAELVRRALMPSREKAQSAIAAGRVRVSGAIALKAAHQVDAGEPILIVGDAPRFVSRGGEKLEGALLRFGLDVNGRIVFDAGASTGGFTDCALQHGAKGVVAVDVGYGQLHERIRSDPRVEVYERVNLRTVDTAAVFGGRQFSLLVGDVSFISLRTLADNLVSLVEPNGSMVLLVKPQFEAGRSEVSKGRGVVRNPDVWQRVLREVSESFELRKAVMMDVMVSPITGTDGNVEFLVWLCKGGVGASAEGRETMIARAIAEEGTSR